MRRIVVTGMGAVTPLAADVEASWSRLLAGRSGIRRLPDDVVGDLPAKVGGVVPSIEEDPDAGFDPDAVLAPKDQRKAESFLVNLAAGHISIRHGFKGPLGAPVTACAAGIQAIGDAARLIRADEADIALWPRPA